MDSTLYCIVQVLLLQYSTVQYDRLDGMDEYTRAEGDKGYKRCLAYSRFSFSFSPFFPFFSFCFLPDLCFCSFFWVVCFRGFLCSVFCSFSYVCWVCTIDIGGLPYVLERERGQES